MLSYSAFPNFCDGTYVHESIGVRWIATYIKWGLRDRMTLHVASPARLLPHRLHRYGHPLP